MVLMLLTGATRARWVEKWGAPEWRLCDCGTPYACGKLEARENCYGCEESLRRIFGENDPVQRIGKPVDGGEGA